MAATPPLTLAVTGLGAVTPVGCTVVETCASLRAGICRFHDRPSYSPRTSDPAWEVPEPLVASVVTTVPPAAAGPARLVELARTALVDLTRNAKLHRADLAQVSLFLALPELDVAVRSWGLGPDLGRVVCEEAGLPSLPVAGVRTEGSAGSLAILGDVLTHLRAHPDGLAIVLGLDSYADDKRLQALDADFRIKSARATDGIVPGEAGVAVLLELAPAAERRQARLRGFITGVGTGQEPQVRASDKESSGRGLTDAVRGALAGSVPPASRWILCDLNGESHRAAEWGVAMSRLAPDLGVIGRLSHPADCLGDVGAAAGGILLACALAGFERGYAAGEEALLWASSSEHGLRAAARVVQRQP